MCFGLMWFQNLLIWLVVLCMVVALIRLLVNFILPKMGLDAEILAFIIQALSIVMWGAICIAAIYFIFSLIYCLAPRLSMLLPLTGFA